jgi:hypothetical protein
MRPTEVSQETILPAPEARWEPFMTSAEPGAAPWCWQPNTTLAGHVSATKEGADERREVAGPGTFAAPQACRAPDLEGEQQHK